MNPRTLTTRALACVFAFLAGCAQQPPQAPQPQAQQQPHREALEPLLPVRVLSETTATGFAFPESVGCDTEHKVLYVSHNHLAVRPGQDWALLLGMLKIIFDKGWEHREDCARFNGIEVVRELAAEPTSMSCLAGATSRTVNRSGGSSPKSRPSSVPPTSWS